MNYYEIEFFFNKSIMQWQVDLLKDDLLYIGFDSFIDNDNEYLNFKGYCPEKDFKEKPLQELLYTSSLKDKVKYRITFIEDQDWNKEWEKNVPSVKIKDFCLIHTENNPQNDNVKYNIIINPKQSFGTANHPTTALIIDTLSEIEVKNKSVIDMGCGTGILGILCKKMGACYVEAIDNDIWAYNSSKENIKKNQVDIVLKKGGSEAISKDKLFDIFIANINLNILLNNVNNYVKHLKKDGILIMSGFYKEDIDTLLFAIKQYNLSLFGYKIKDNWATIILQ